MTFHSTNEFFQGVYLFGRDISHIPCFRNSYLYGIGAGFAGGLTTFFFTSRTRLATHVGVGCFAATTLVYWTQCRYKFSQTKFQYAQLKAGMQAHVTHEGTALEKEIQKEV